MNSNYKIRTAAVLGAGGAIGNLVAGIIAQEGIKVYLLSRSEEKALWGRERAVAQARSEVIKKHIICGSYDSLLSKALKEADWIVECISEDIRIKQGMYGRVESLKKNEAIISTTTSSLPLTLLVKGRTENFQRYFLSTHFYNPPGKMLACEIAGQGKTDPEVLKFMSEFLKRALHRVVIPVRNLSGFAGNRIAFLILSKITKLARKYGVEKMDYLLGPYTGRILPPLATIDLVGLDIHREIVKNLFQNTDDEMHDELTIPEYVNKMIQEGLLGHKSPAREGFYKRDKKGGQLYFDPSKFKYIPARNVSLEFVESAKELIHMGRYREAFNIIKATRSPEADIVMDTICSYISYSYARIGEVTETKYGIEGIDRVMTYGFNWASPSMITELLGGPEQVIGLLKDRGIAPPEYLLNLKTFKKIIPNQGKYFIAR